MTGIYGMNVTEISGDKHNPAIWQFFAAVLVMNVIMLGVLGGYSWAQLRVRLGRKVGTKQALWLALGRID